MSNKIRSALGDVNKVITVVTDNIFVRFFLWLVLVWSCCSTKDLRLFLLVALYFVIPNRSTIAGR